MDQDNGAVLIVDDEPEMCWAIERILHRHGVVCQTAPNAKEAMALAERQSFRMAFLDAKLPDMDGLDLARRIREFAPGLRIVVVSGYFYQDSQTIQGALRTGLISAFLAKPFVHDEILRALDAPAR
jgi:DNA-binding NtrC family response regulator